MASRLLNTLSVNVQKMYVDTLIAMGEDVSQYKDEFQNGKPGKRKNAEGTPSLDQFSRDLTELARDGKLDPVVGRETEIDRVIQILSRRSKNNPCLIGEPGVGKTAIVEGIAERIMGGMVPDTVLGKRVVSLDLSGIVAGSKYRGEFEERIKKVLAEAVSYTHLDVYKRQPSDTATMTLLRSKRRRLTSKRKSSGSKATSGR